MAIAAAAKTPTPSIMSEKEWKELGLPLPPEGYGLDASPVMPASARYVDVGDGHKIYVQEFGNPDGEPLIYLHGGPGGGGDATRPRYYDQKRYRIIMFDQRGCGNSIPKMHQDYDAAMKGNNTAGLINDIDKIRDALGIKGKAHITGGSWGSTLALAYAIKHPEKVKSLILFGIFLGSEAGREYLFQGNAQLYKPSRKPLTNESTPEEIQAFLKRFDAQPIEDPQTGKDLAGGYRAYVNKGKLRSGQIPEEFHAENQHMRLAIAKAWDEYVRVIPQDQRHDMPAAYTAILARDPALLSPKERKYQLRVAFAFSKWEGLLTQFSHGTDKNGKIDLGKFEGGEFALTFARTEATYMRDRFYLTEDGSPAKPDSNYILDNLWRIAKHKIPMFIVHGKRDQVCRPEDAITLRDAYRELGGTVDFTMPERTSHLQKERGTAHACLRLIKEKLIPLFTHTDWEEQKKPASYRDTVRRDIMSSTTLARGFTGP